jgi:hypothetical protein
MKHPFTFLMLAIFILSLSSCDKNEPDEITDFAYPPEEMLRYFDFPEGSWWAYKCLNDGTIDTLFVLVSEDASRVSVDPIGEGYFKNRRCQYNYISENGYLELGMFTKRSAPAGTVFRGESSNHKTFSLYVASSNDSFNGQYPFKYPFKEFEFEYEIKDTLIQSARYQNALCLPHSWINSTLENAIESEIYVQDIGVVKYTTVGKDTYELIDFIINE